MGFDKGHKEFHTLDMSEGWHTLPGYPLGIEEKIIAGALDEKAKRGNRTRLLRFAPGVYTTAPFVHDRGGKGGRKFAGYTYAVRPPGAVHGPFKSETGCLLLETHFYSEG